MTPPVKNLVVSAVDWNELCPWLLFRRCLGLSFSFRLLFFATLHLLICTILLSSAFGLLHTEALSKILERYSLVSSYMPRSTSSAGNFESFLDEIPAAYHDIPSSSELNSAQKQTGVPEQTSAQKQTVIPEQTSALEQNFTSGKIPETPVPGASGASETEIASQQTPFSKMMSAESLDFKRVHEKNPFVFRVFSKPEKTPKSLLIGAFVYRFFAVTYTLFTTILFWMLTARLAAIRIAREVRVYLFQELKFAFSRFPAVLAAAFFLVSGCALILAPLWLCGFLSEMPLACVTPFLLIYAVFAFFFLAGAVLGIPFVLSVFMTENSDVFDALSRSYAYALQKPLNFLFYLLAALFFGVLGLHGAALCVGLTAHLYVSVLNVSVSASSMMETMLLAFSWAVSAFLFLYASAAWQGIYMLLRRDVDGVELNVVWLPSPQDVPVPKLPDLKTDPKNT